MSLILSIDTAASYNCSVALSDGEKIIVHSEIDSHNHTQALLPAIRQVLKSSGKSVHDLSAIAVNIGPGSYTGLRVGLATAKGLCYSYNLPLLPIHGLLAMANYAIEQNKGIIGTYIVVQDNYRSGWYYSLYDEKLNSISPQGSCNRLEEIFLTINSKPIFVFGNSISENDLAGIDYIHLIPYVSITANHLIPLASLLLKNDTKFDLRSIQPLYINSIFSSLQD